MPDDAQDSGVGSKTPCPYCGAVQVKHLVVQQGRVCLRCPHCQAAWEAPDEGATAPEGASAADGRPLRLPTTFEHQLRNLLGVIQGEAEWLLQNSSPELLAQRASLQAILDACDQVMALTRELAD